MTHAIEVRNLVKRYGDLTAVDGVSFTVSEGETVALLGPNGSGKSSILRAVTATGRIDEGSVTILGKDVASEPRTVKGSLGVVHQEDTLDPDLTVLENLLVHCRYFGARRDAARTRSAELLRRFGLETRADEPINRLSGGMRRRLMLARAFTFGRVLVLDEPTTGLDPEARLALWADLRGLLADGVAILLTSHDMEESERLADRIVLLDKGKVRREGTCASLIAAETSGRIFEIRVPVPRLGEAESLCDELRIRIAEGTGRVSRLGGFIFCETDRASELTSWAKSRALPLTDRPANLGDVYRAVTGHGLVS